MNIYYPEDGGPQPAGSYPGTKSYDEPLNLSEISTNDLKVGTTGLPDATSDHTVQTAGIVLHQRGWRDLVAPFTSTSAGGAAPTLATLSNGTRLYRFSVNDSVHASYHVDHDYAPNTNAYHHVHWFPETAMAEGDTVTWRISYVVGKGHDQNGNLLAARTDIDMTYTAPVGGTAAGTHIVTEASDLQAYSLEEPDTVVLAEIKLQGVTGYAGNVVGIQADLHYLSDREVTRNKTPGFNDIV